MAFLEFKIDLTRTVEALNRIADALDRAVPKRTEEKAKPMRFFNVDPAAIAEDEEEADRKREAGTEGT